MAEDLELIFRSEPWNPQNRLILNSYQERSTVLAQGLHYTKPNDFGDNDITEHGLSGYRYPLFTTPKFVNDPDKVSHLSNSM
ncbi:hypothetical protein KIN20_035364 [Parelaphostrongylus tenuis]|uniref:Uncharacterized protein n=1 Tax=Parelaphostrongylus tenuis TaxID=148309 RepID=A0AAD5RB08_PARTN|nr:hypothetical protein KIN20_035364 [Parelaphostrongylus tenuis]